MVTAKEHCLLWLWLKKLRWECDTLSWITLSMSLYLFISVQTIFPCVSSQTTVQMVVKLNIYFFHDYTSLGLCVTMHFHALRFCRTSFPKALNLFQETLLKPHCRLKLCMKLDNYFHNHFRSGTLNNEGLSCTRIYPLSLMQLKCSTNLSKRFCMSFI